MSGTIASILADADAARGEIGALGRGFVEIGGRMADLRVASERFAASVG